MTSRNIIIIDFSSAAFTDEYSHKEFAMVLADANARGITVAEAFKDAAIENVARRKGIIVDFPLS